MILVSACLVGINCKYSGEHNDNKEVRAYLKGKSYIPVCPEQLGGLSTPRPSCELVGNRVLNAYGEDCTNAFKKGAREALKIAKLCGCDTAILKEASPSCGCKVIYDGTFSGKKISGMGLTARLLSENGIGLQSEKDLLNQ